MTNLSDQELLRNYAAQRSEAAFAELVRRHVDLVYSAALRMVRDTHLAEDVTQGTFAALARNAGQLADRAVLAGWLHRTAQNIAAQTVRTETRRHAREQEAASMNELLSSGSEVTWEHIRPHLDAAVGELDAPHRDALLLRYFKRKSAQEIGETLGISPEAAQKRVNRAVDRLRELFAKRGVTIGAGGLVTVISTNAMQSAPAGLAATICAAMAMTGKAIVTTTTATKAIAMTTLQKTSIAVALAVAVSAPLAIQHHTQTQLRLENELLRTQLSRQAHLAADDERLSNLPGQMTNSQSLPKAQFDELLRLRGEVGRLRTETRELAQMKVGAKAAVENPANPLLAQLQQMPEKSIPELQLLDEKKWAEDAAKGKLDTPDGVREALANVRRAAKIRFAFELGTALDDFAQANKGQLPGSVFDLKPYFKYPADQQPVDDTVFQRYELLHTGNLNDQPPGEPLIAEKSPVDDEYDTLFKIGANSYTVQGTGKWGGRPPFTSVWNSGAGPAK